MYYIFIIIPIIYNIITKLIKYIYLKINIFNIRLKVFAMLEIIKILFYQLSLLIFKLS